MNRGSNGGTFTRAKCSLKVLVLRTTTARLSDSPEMYGNGCAGSTANGVRTGKTASRNISCSRSCSTWSSSSHRTTVMPSEASNGRTSRWNTWACRSIRSWARTPISSSTSRGSSPDAERTAIPVAMRRLRPATRTMKNSSRLLAKMATNRTRSSSGSPSSCASWSTRWLNCSQLASRSRNRSPSIATVAVGEASAALVMPRWLHRRPTASTGVVRSAPSSWVAVVLDVHVGAREAEALVGPDGGGVVGVDVEHRLGQSAVPQVLKPGDRQHAAQPAALVVRRHADDVDLARGGAFGVRLVDLGPVEAGQPAVVVLQQQKPVGFEPRLSHAQPQVPSGPRPLLRVAREGRRVEGEPGGLVLTGTEGAEGQSVRH